MAAQVTGTTQETVKRVIARHEPTARLLSVPAGATISSWLVITSRATVGAMFVFATAGVGERHLVEPDGV